MSETLESAKLTRRTFVAGSTLAGLSLAAAQATPAFADAAETKGAAQEGAVAQPAEGEEIIWTHCHVNCGGACPLQCHVKDDEIVSVECDTTGSSEFGAFQPRACLRGRSIRRWINGADRLNYPMRRVPGTERGEGKYERISWEEALDTIASEFTRIKETYGNEAVFVQECSGVEQNVMMNSPFFRLFNPPTVSLISLTTSSL